MNRTIKIFKKISVILLGFLLIYNVGIAQEVNKIPSLGEHIFVPGNYAASPFTNTFFRSNIGIGSTLKITFPILEIDGEPVVGIKGSLLFASLGFTYQQKVRDWVAVRATYRLNARLGTDVLSLLAQGVSTVNQFKLQWLFKLWEGERHLLSTTVGINNYSGNFISISKFIEDILDNDPNASITKNIPVLNTELGLYFAYALTEVTGLRLTVEGTYGENFRSDNNSLDINFGGSFDFNFFSKYDVPLGLLVGYHALSSSDHVYLNKNFANLGTFNIIYMGTTDFTIGLENSLVSLPVEGLENDAIAYTVVISMVYVFN